MTVRVLTRDITTGRQAHLPNAEECQFVFGAAGSHGTKIITYDSALAELELVTSRGDFRESRCEFIWDFIGHAEEWSQVANGSGTAAKQNLAGGVRRETTGAVSGDYNDLYIDQGDQARTAENCMWEARVRPAPTGSVSNIYLQFGIEDIGVGTNIVVFIADPSSSSNWTAYHSSASAASSADTGIAYTANTWYLLRAECTTTQTEFFINNSSVATLTTNLPSSTIPMAPRLYVGTTAAAAKSFDVDFFKLWTARRAS